MEKSSVAEHTGIRQEEFDKVMDKFYNSRPTCKTGHPLFRELTEEELELHEAKNKDYRSDSDPLANFKRVSAWMELYPNMNWAQPELVACIYAMKQFDAYMSLMERGVEGGVENCDTRLRDDHIYKKIMRILHRERVK